MHTSVAQGRYCSSLQFSSWSCRKVKLCPLALSFSTTKILNSVPTEVLGLVLAKTINRSALPANVHQVFTPLISQSPLGSRRALVVMPATSLPKSGSVTATADMHSPDAIRGKRRCFWLSVPPFSIARASISGRVMREPPNAQ